MLSECPEHPPIIPHINQPNICAGVKVLTRKNVVCKFPELISFFSLSHHINKAPFYLMVCSGDVLFFRFQCRFVFKEQFN